MNLNYILQNSDNLQHTGLYANQITGALIDYCEVLQTIKRIFCDPSEPNHLRLFVEDIDPKYKAVTFLQDNLPKEGEEFTDWLIRLFGERKFGIIINRVEKWSDSFLECTLPIIDELSKTFPYHSYSYELTLFIGNYAFTPFGVHRDGANERTLHFNLGPDDREMLLWDKKDFIKLTGSENIYFDPQRISKDCTRRFNISPFDVFVLKGDEFHIGHNKGFSVGLAIAIQQFGKERYLDFLLKQMAHENSPVVFGENAGKYMEESQQLKLNATFNKKLSQTANSLSAKEFLYLLKSNHGLLTPVAEADVKFDPSLSYSKYPVFCIVYFRHRGKLHIFIRGHKFVIQYHAPIVKLFRYINRSTKPFSVVSLSAQFGVDEKAMVALLEILHNYKMITCYD